MLFSKFFFFLFFTSGVGVAQFRGSASWQSVDLDSQSSLDSVDHFRRGVWLGGTGAWDRKRVGKDWAESE